MKPVESVSERIVKMHKNLLEQRILLIEGVLTPARVTAIKGQLQALSEKSEKIDIYINSSGGSVSSVLPLAEMMLQIPLITTTVLEDCMGAASLILASGAKGSRIALSHARISINQDMWIKDDGNCDMQKAGETILEIRDRVAQFFSSISGKEKRLFEKFISSKQPLKLQEALELNLIDRIVKA